MFTKRKFVQLRLIWQEFESNKSSILRSTVQLQWRRKGFKLANGNKRAVPRQKSRSRRAQISKERGHPNITSSSYSNSNNNINKYQTCTTLVRAKSVGPLPWKRWSCCQCSRPPSCSSSLTIRSTKSLRTVVSLITKTNKKVAGMGPD